MRVVVRDSSIQLLIPGLLTTMMELLFTAIYSRLGSEKTRTGGKLLNRASHLRNTVSFYCTVSTLPWSLVSFILRLLKAPSNSKCIVWAVVPMWFVSKGPFLSTKPIQ